MDGSKSRPDGSSKHESSCHDFPSWGFVPAVALQTGFRQISDSAVALPSSRIAESALHDLNEPGVSCIQFNFWDEPFATASGATSLELATPRIDRPFAPTTATTLPSSALASSSRSRCPMASDDAMQKPNQQTEMIGEDDLRDRFKRPDCPRARQNCIRQYRIMQRRCLDHACDQTPCFDEACTFGMPQDSGCRYSAAFFTRESTSPCIWAWGKILLEHEERYGREAAMTVDLEGMSHSYRERHERDQRFQGPALVTDPPNPSEGSMYYWVIRPAEQKGKEREDTM